MIQLPNKQPERRRESRSSTGLVVFPPPIDAAAACCSLLLVLESIGKFPGRHPSPTRHALPEPWDTGKGWYKGLRPARPPLTPAAMTKTTPRPSSPACPCLVPSLQMPYCTELLLGGPPLEGIPAVVVILEPPLAVLAAPRHPSVPAPQRPSVLLGPCCCRQSRRLSGRQANRQATKHGGGGQILGGKRQTGDEAA